MARPSYTKSSSKSVKNNPLDLDLPDWSGMDDHRHTQRLTLQEALVLSEEFRRKNLSDPRFLKEWQQRKKCQVEFVF